MAKCTVPSSRNIRKAGRIRTDGAFVHWSTMTNIEAFVHVCVAPANTQWLTVGSGVERPPASLDRDLVGTGFRFT